jgi:hypothetical protein
MNLITRTLIKLGILKEDLDYHFARASMVITFLFSGFWYPRRHLVFDRTRCLPHERSGPFGSFILFAT